MSIFGAIGMRTLYTATILLLLLLQVFTLRAQNSVPQSNAVFYVWEDSSRTFQPAEVLQQYQHGAFRQMDNLFLNPGFTGSVFWIALAADTLTAEEVLLVNNAAINYLEWYRVTPKGSIDSLAFTGDGYVFHQRPILYNYSALPLQPRAPLYLLKIDKHFESLQAPLQLVTRSQLAATIAQESLVNGLLSGVALLMVLFGCFLFVTTKDQLYIWYALYVFCLSMWIWSDKGLGFQYLWPSSSYFPSRSRPFFLGATMLVSIQFLQLFIGQGKNSWCYRPMKVVQVCCILMLVLVLWPFDYTRAGAFMLVFLRFITLLSVVYSVLYFASLIEKIRKGSRLAKVYFLATIVLFAFSFAESLSHFGHPLFTPFPGRYGMFTGVVLEAMIIMFGMAERFNRYRREREALLAEKSEEQKRLTDTIVSVQENERKAVADQLHDEVGSLLSLASLNLDAAREKQGWESMAKMEQAGEVLQMVSHSIRSISHQLSPLAIEQYGFRRAVENLVGMANQSGKIQVELVLIGFEQNSNISVNFRNTLYRLVQELLQNILKHAKAVHVLVQLIEHEDSIGIMVEDDGAGMKPDSNGTFFLRSVQSKVDYLEGQMVIESAEGRGTMVNIEIPYTLTKPTDNYALPPDYSR